MSNITILGNLGADPVLRTLGNGSYVCNMRLAENNGENVTWYNVTAWDELAVQMSKSKKGAQVLVMGALEVSTWDREVTSPLGETFKVKTDTYSIRAQTIFPTGTDLDLVDNMPIEHIPEMTHAN